MSKLHVLKTWPRFFSAVRNDAKTFEVRKNDRDYEPWDVLLLREWDPETGRFTGGFCARMVGYIMQGGNFGLDEDYVVMQLRHCSAAQLEDVIRLLLEGLTPPAFRPASAETEQRNQSDE